MMRFYAAPAVAERGLARVRASLRSLPDLQASSGVLPVEWFASVAAPESGFALAFPSVRLKPVLAETARATRQTFVAIVPGARFLDHEHVGAGEGRVLRRDVLTGGRRLRAGDDYFAALGAR